MNEKKKHPLLAVRAIIQNEDDRILLLKRASKDEYGDLWCLPGGKIDFGQTAEEAIVREVLEETLLECNSVEFLLYQDGLPQNKDEKHYLTLIFKCKAEGEIELNGESSEFIWIGPQEIEKYDIAFNNDEAIRMYWREHG